MSQSRRQFLGQAAAAASSGAVMPAIASEPSTRQRPPKVSRKVRSISAMTFAPDGKLVVADWRAGALHALVLPARTATAERPFNLVDLSDRLGSALGRRSDELRVTAAAPDPASQTVVLAVTLGRRSDAPVAIVWVDAAGKVQSVDMDKAWSATHSLRDVPQDGEIWQRQPVRTLTVTDLKAHGAELLVAGLSHTDFSSTLRRVPYPFAGPGSASMVSMYHAVHNQIETRAPIRTFSVIDVAGTPTLLAAYTCTPLVTVPLAELVDGAKVRGKTIAELGFGNTPLDMVAFSIEYRGQKSDWVLVANSAKAADLIKLDDVVAAAQRPGLSQPVTPPFNALAGLKALPMPITNVQRVMDQGPQFLTALRRDPDSGQLQLVSIRKGAFFRLSDFINEYDIPGYAYPEGDAFQQQYIRPFHRRMKTDEGHEALIR